jgi:hypothetical protein
MDSGYNYGQILKSIQPNAYSGSQNGAFQPQTWSQQINNANRAIEQAIKYIFIVIPYLDSEDIELFTELYSSSYLELVNNIDLFQLDGIEFLGEVMYKFNELIEQVKTR